MTKTKAINSTEIARLAGVSRSTVSKVINNYPDIPEETKRKVRSVIKQHRYEPNAFAQILKGKPQSVVTLYVYASEADIRVTSTCSIGSPYVMGVISNFIVMARQYHHRMMVEVLNHGDDEQDILATIRGHFESKSISSAVFLGLTDQTRFIDQLVAEGFPIAVLDREVAEGHRAVSIFTDDHKGAYEVTRHVIGREKKHIAFIGGAPHKRSAKMRHKGYLQAMKESGLKPCVIEGDYSEEAGILAADQVLVMQSRPEAVVCSCDALAYGFIKRMREVDSDYLKTLSLTGFDDTCFNDFLCTPLSSVRVDFEAMARITITALLGEGQGQPELVPVELVVRP